MHFEEKYYELNDVPCTVNTYLIKKVLRGDWNFNGYIVRKMGTFRYYPQPLKYKLIQGLKKLLKRS